MPNFIVRTVSPITRDHAFEAVEVYKRQLREADLDELLYRVEDRDTGEMVYVYKELTVTENEMEEAMAMRNDHQQPTDADFDARIRQARASREAEDE